MFCQKHPEVQEPEFQRQMNLPCGMCFAERMEQENQKAPKFAVVAEREPEERVMDSPEKMEAMARAFESQFGEPYPTAARV